MTLIREKASCISKSATSFFSLARLTRKRWISAGRNKFCFPSIHRARTLRKQMKTCEIIGARPSWFNFSFVVCSRQKRPICFHLLIGSNDHGVLRRLRGNKFCFFCTACVIGRPHHTLTLTVPRRLPLSDPGRQSATTTETRAEGAGGKGGHSLEEHPLPKYHFR